MTSWLAYAARKRRSLESLNLSLPVQDIVNCLLAIDERGELGPSGLISKHHCKTAVFVIKDPPWDTLPLQVRLKPNKYRQIGYLTGEGRRRTERAVVLAHRASYEYRLL